MTSSKNKFDPKLLPDPAFIGNEDLIRELEWFLSDLKGELLIAVNVKNASRSKELTAKIKEVEAKIKQLWAELSTPVAVPPMVETKEHESEKKSHDLPVPIKNAQIDLFRQFTTNFEGDVSNSLEVWDLIPKYFVTTAQAKSLRDDNGLPLAATWDYKDKEGDSEITFSVTITPVIMVKKGGKKAQQQVCFPGPTEELIEEVLKKFLLDQQLGQHDPKTQETWVKFSLNMIQKELTARGKSRSNTEIRDSLELMNKSHIKWVKQGKSSYEGHIISELLTVNRSDYDADGTTLWAAKLPSLVSSAINNLSYRQFNYPRFFKMNDSLSRWLYRRLIIKYKQAATDKPYTIHFKKLKQLSALLEQQDERGNRKKLLSALEELKAVGVLCSFEAIDIKAGRQITDVKYILIPSDKFIAEQKAASKRLNEVTMKAIEQGLK